MWQDLRHFEDLRAERSPGRILDDAEFFKVDKFFDDFKTSYKSTITRAQDHLERLKDDQHRLGAIALLPQISSAWQSFPQLDQSLDKLLDLVRFHEAAGDSVTALVLLEGFLSRNPLNAFSAEAEATSGKLLNLYDSFMDLVARVASRLDLDIDTCLIIAPIPHRMVRLNNTQLFNSEVLRNGVHHCLQDYLSRTLAHVAAECNAVHALKELLAVLLRIDSFDLFGRTPLLTAVQSNSITAVRHLLGLPAKWYDENDLLEVAVGAGLKDMVQLLLVEGDLSSTRKNARNLGLKLAASKGCLEIVRLLLIAGADLNDTEVPLDNSSDPKTALSCAAEGGHLEVVRDLLRSNADVSARFETSGMTPLHEAALNGHYNIARVLLQAGANIKRTAWRKLATRPASALELASAQGHVPVVRLLVASNSSMSWGLNAAARYGHLDAVNVLLESGAEIDDLNRTRTTALLQAVVGGHLAIVQRLLEVKANFEAFSQLNTFMEHRFCTPLHIASGKGSTDIVRMLVDAGANINAVNTRNGNEKSSDAVSRIEDTGSEYSCDGSEEDIDEDPHLKYLSALDFGGDTLTPLQLAAYRGHTQTVQLLISAGANVNAEPQMCRLTALQSAAFEGHLDTFHVLMKANADVNASATGADGLTALQGASERGHVHIVQLLLRAYADVNAPASARGATALQSAAAGRHLEIIQLLLSAGADADAGSLTRGTPLQIAAMNGDVEIVQSLLQARATVDTIPTKRSGHTALQGAAEGGHLEVVKLLLDAHADVNFIHAHCVGSALQLAASRTNLEVVRLLLIANANPNYPAIHSSGMTILQGAAKAGNVEIVRLLLEANADVNGSMNGMTSLQYAAQANHGEVLVQLMSAGAYVNALPEGGETALMHAVHGGHYNMVKCLLSFGADVNERGTDKPSALHIAVRSAAAELVYLLLDAGADVNACSGAEGRNSPLGAAARSGNTALAQRLLMANADVDLANPLAAAATCGQVDIVRVLLDKGADVNSMKSSSFNGGRPALVCAADFGYVEVVQMLLEAGTKLDIVERALSIAACRHLEVVQVLLKNGPDPNAVHATYNSALRRAAEIGNFEILRLLLLAGADPNAPTSLRQSEDCTALEVAVSHGHLDAVRLLLYAGADVNPPPSTYFDHKTLLQLAQSCHNLKVLQILEDANPPSCPDGSRKRKRKRNRRTVDLDETSSSESDGL